MFSHDRVVVVSPFQGHGRCHIHREAEKFVRAEMWEFESRRIDVEASQVAVSDSHLTLPAIYSC